MDVIEAIRKKIRTIPDFPKSGIQFKDITPILEDPILSNAVLAEFLNLYDGVQIDAVAGLESRGFLYGLPLALHLSRPFIVVRKKGKLPGETVGYKYDLEYGSAEIEVQKGSIKKGMHILIHDDLLATGGTAGAAAEIIKKEGGIIAGFSFLIELNNLKGREELARFDKPIVSLVRYD